jgi:hypothetical protein
MLLHREHDSPENNNTQNDRCKPNILAIVAFDHVLCLCACSQKHFGSIIIIVVPMIKDGYFDRARSVPTRFRSFGRPRNGSPPSLGESEVPSETGIRA